MEKWFRLWSCDTRHSSLHPSHATCVEAVGKLTSCCLAVLIMLLMEILCTEGVIPGHVKDPVSHAADV